MSQDGDWEKLRRTYPNDDPRRWEIRVNGELLTNARLMTGCAHQDCNCVPGPGALRQFKCPDCERYSTPSRFDRSPAPGMADGYVEGCWVATGYRCPECSAA